MYRDRVVLTSRDILEKEFKIDTRGYRPQEVDRFLDMIIKDYEEMHSIIHDLEKENKHLTEEELEQEIRNNFKMNGLILGDVEVVKMMDNNLTTGNSNIIPAYIDKDGNVSKNKPSILEKEDFDLRDSKKVAGIYKQGYDLYGDDYKKVILNDLKKIGYSISDIKLDILRLANIPVYGLSVKEEELKSTTDQSEMSQGMFRALSLLIQINYAFTTLIINGNDYAFFICFLNNSYTRNFVPFDIFTKQSPIALFDMLFCNITTKRKSD